MIVIDEDVDLDDEWWLELIKMLIEMMYDDWNWGRCWFRWCMMIVVVEDVDWDDVWWLLLMKLLI